MPTITDTLAQLGQDLRDAIAGVRGVYADVVSIKNSTVSQTTNIINNFLGRPAVQTLFVDPVGGSDDNDGLTVDTPKKSIDRIIASIGTTATAIYLFGDTTIANRNNLNASLSIAGVQRSNAPPYFVPFNRTITFLGTALNSPLPGIGTFCSGLWCYSTNVITSNINYSLPDVPAGLDYRTHLSTSGGTSFSFVNGTLTAGSAGAGSLCGAIASRSTVFVSMVLGSNAPGHLMLGVGAGANPNSQFAYQSNITSA